MRVNRCDTCGKDAAGFEANAKGFWFATITVHTNEGIGRIVREIDACGRECFVAALAAVGGQALRELGREADPSPAR